MKLTDLAGFKVSTGVGLFGWCYIVLSEVCNGIQAKLEGHGF